MTRFPDGSGYQPSDLLAAALAEQLALLREQTAFEVLGVPTSTDAEQVESAYELQVERWEPVRYASRSLDVQVLAAEIRAVIQHAYDELSDPVRFVVLRAQAEARSSGRYHESGRGTAVARLGSDSDR